MAFLRDDTAVGISLEEGAVHAVVLRGSTGTPSVEGSVSVSFTEGEKAVSLHDALSSLIKEHHVPTDNVVVVPGQDSLILREVELPFHSDEEIRKTLKFQVEETLPIAAEDCVVDYVKGPAHDGGQRLLVAAVKKDTMEEVLRACEESDMDVVAVEPAVGALLNAAAWRNHEARNSLLLDIRESGMLLVACNGEGPVTWRRSGTVTDKTSVRRIVTEIKRTAAVTGLGDDDIRKIVVSTVKDEILEALKSTFEHVEVIPLFPHDTSISHAYTLAIGAALKKKGFDASGMNLRQEEYTYRHKVDQLKVPLWVLSIALLVGAIGWNMRITKIHRQISAQLAQIDVNALSLLKRTGITPPSRAPIRKIVNELGNRIALLKEGMQQKKLRSALEEWKECSRLLPADKDVDITRILVTQRGITLSGTAPSNTKAEEVQKKLNANGRFRFALPETRSIKGGRVSFTLKHEYER